MYFNAAIESKLTEHDLDYVNKIVEVFEFAEFLDFQIYRIIAPHFGEEFEFGVEVKQGHNLQDGDLIPKGYYVSMDEYGGDCITLQLDVSKDTKPYFMYMDADKWSWIKFEIAQVIDHEIIHAEQHAKKNYRQTKPFKYGKTYEQSYYGCSEEIEAYAFNTAHDLLRYYRGDVDKAIESLKADPLSFTKEMSIILMVYCDLFRGKHDDIWKKYIRTTVKFLQKIDEITN